MNFTCLISGIFFIILGILFAMGQVHKHMEVWKNMPESEKADIAIGPLCRNMGAMVIICGLIFLSAGVWSNFKNQAFIWCMLIWFIACGLDVYFIQKGSRYKNSK
ncbi:MAG: DUF3784 domain-containing protein [Candidatus Gastranaerophilales bacterium]|nr:DUF3784 domain-containing protein [Candidatus Gastranaerophilales bacterium]